MKPFLLILALSFFANIGTSHAEIDCNSPSLDKINAHYICTTPKLKELNNQLTFLAKEKMRDRVVQDQIMSNTQIKKNNKPNESAQMPNKEVYEYRGQIDSWLNRKLYEIYKCRNEKCIESAYIKALEQLKHINHKSRCFLSEIAQKGNCEILVYTPQRSSNRSTDIMLTDQYYTFQETLKINKPNTCFYLVLSSPLPVVWDIYTQKETKIEAVLVSGKFPQLIRGLDKNIPISNLNQETDFIPSTTTCLYKDYEFEEISKILKENNVTEEKIFQMTTPKIGGNIEDFNYNFFVENINGKPLKEKVPVREDGWDELIQQGKARKATAIDFKNFKKVGLINIDNDYFLWENKYYKNIYEDPMLTREAYILLEYIPLVPEGHIFIPMNIQPPKNLKTKPTFIGIKEKRIMPIFDKTYVIKTLAEEVKKW